MGMPTENANAYTVTVVALQKPMAVNELYTQRPVEEAIRRWEQHGPSTRTINVLFGTQELPSEVTGLRRKLTVTLQDPDSEGTITLEGNDAPIPLLPLSESIEITGRRWGRWGEKVVFGLIIPETEGSTTPPPNPSERDIWPRGQYSLDEVLTGLDRSGL